MKLDKFKNLQFLSPRLTIKLNHLKKDDVKNIKSILNVKLGSAAFVISIILALISLTLFFYLQIESGWKQVEKYGISSLISDIGCFAMSVVALVLKLVSLKLKDDKAIMILNRLAIVALYISISILMFCSFYADAEKGFLSETPTMSVSIIAIAFLLIVQPIYSLDAIILNVSMISAMITLSIYTRIKFDTQSFLYYILIAIVFIILSRLFVSTIFYAESQKYIQESISNSLLDTAMYDELTHCKNRYALKKYLEKKVPLWREKETKLLIVMFDIDNFKEYNDYFSHQVGDGCLKSIAGAVKKHLKSPNLEFYRFGGEEFLLFFELNEQERAEDILEGIRLSISELDIKAPPTSKLDYLTISVGGYLSYTNSQFEFDKALGEADANLYKAKGDGKNVSYINGNKVVKE